MAAAEGGFAPTVWLPVALSLLGLAAVLALAAPGRLAGPLDRSGLAIGLLAAFVGWLFLSIGWAEDRAAAWNGANRALLYLLVFALLARWGSTARVARLALGVLAAALAALVVVTVARAFGGGDPFRLFIGSRLSAPTGYPNATAALTAIAAWPLVVLSTSRALSVAARAGALGLAVLLVDLGLLAQSRGSAYTMPLVALAVLLVSRDRLRVLVGIALAAVAVVPAIGPILDVFAPEDAAELRADLRAAAAATAVSVALALAAGLAAALVDRRVSLGPGALRAARVALTVTAVAAVVLAAATRSPVASARTAWDDFRHHGEPVGAPTHFHGLGSNRYDFWRVGLGEFRDHPLAGIGADNFSVPYLERRRSPEEPLYPHSLPVALLSQTGVVGTGLAALFVAAALAAAHRARGARGEAARAALAGFFVLLFHASVDWLWEMPVVGAAGLALLGLAVGLARADERGGRVPHAPRLLAVPAAVVALAAAASLAFPWLAARAVEDALRSWRRDPAAALDRLETARRLNPLSDRADVLAGAIASRLGRDRLMEERYARAVARAPGDWYAQLGLAVAASRTGRPELARAAAASAARLNPREPVVRRVARRIAAGRPVEPAAVDRAFAEPSPDRD